MKHRPWLTTERGLEIFARLEALPCPSVAVINGFALGGGLELALACSWRLVLEGYKPTLGLPEVNLGLHPGLGGTVRLVRLVGVREALPMMLTGRSITPEKARKIGLADQLIAPENWRTAAAEMARAAAPRRQPPFIDRLLSLGLIRPILASLLRKQVAARARPDQYPAPFAVVDLWQAEGARGSAAYRAEARSFAAAGAKRHFAKPGPCLRLAGTPQTPGPQR